MERTNFLQFAIKVSRQPQTNKIGLLSRNLLNQQWGRHISSFLGPHNYEKKELIKIIKNSNCFEIVMYKENGKNIHLKEKHSEPESDESDSDESDNTRVHWYWVMEQQKNIRDRLTPEKLGNYKNCKILPTLRGSCVLILFENLMIEMFLTKENGEKVNKLFQPIPNTTLYK